MATIPLKTITFPGLDNTYTVPQLDDTLTTAGKAADAKATGDRLDELEASEATKANIDGSYEQMTVGNAEQLVSSIKEEDKVPYVFRTSGGSIDIGDREEDKIIGGTVAWNQLFKNGDFSNGTTNWDIYSSSRGTLSVSNNVATLTYNGEYAGGYEGGLKPKGYTIGLQTGHKYLFCCDAKADFNTSASIEIGTGVGSAKALTINQWNKLAWIEGRVSWSNGTTVMIKPTLATIVNGSMLQFKNMQFIDLTQMFGSTIADYIYSLEQATTGAGVAWFRKLFPNDYYPYDAGTLKHVSGLVSHDMTGFNQWDEEWEVGAIDDTGVPATIATEIRSKNFCPCIADKIYYLQKPSRVDVCWYDANKVFISKTKASTGTLVLPTNAQYFKIVTVGYGATYNHDICINLSWDGSRNGEYEPYVKHSYPLDSTLTLRGIPKLDASNQVYYDGDEYESDGTVTRKYAVVDLGTLEWSLRTTGTVNKLLSCSLPYKYIDKGWGVKINAISDKYEIRGADNATNLISTIETASTGFYTFNSGAGTQANTAYLVIPNATTPSGYLVYELATPTTEEADPYQNPQIVDDFGTEEYVIDNTVTVPIPVGHDTFYQANLVAKLEMAPNSPEGDGDYIVRQTNGENAYVPITFPADELPAAPTTDGNYVLKCTVASGTATFTWEAQ